MDPVLVELQPVHATVLAHLGDHLTDLGAERDGIFQRLGLGPPAPSFTHRDQARSGLEDAAEVPPLDRPVSEGRPGGRPGRQQVIATLERWLDNLRGGIRA